MNKLRGQLKMIINNLEQDKNQSWFKENQVNLFYSKIYYCKIERYQSVDAELKEALKDVDWRRKDSWGKTHFLSDPTFKENFIEEKNLKIFKQEIEYHVGQYTKLHGKVLKKFAKNYDIVDSWAAKFEPGDYAHVHNHGYADIAGVYYYKRPTSKSKHCGNIFFNAPGPEYNANPLYSPMARASWYFPEGTLVLFPGFLPHGVETNETEKDRISISFNIRLRR